MNKYKLVKEYPGSPKIGYISQKTHDNDLHYYKGITFDPSAYPDYWEKIVEKDYKVLSLISTRDDKTIITYENGGGVYGAGFFESVYKSVDYWVECFTGHNNPWSIYSIKRLSDGEIFTIGDTIKGYFDDKNPYMITNIFISDNDNLVLSNYQKNSSHTKGNRSTWLSKNFPQKVEIKKLLFKTEDGVDIFEGDLFYTVSRNLSKFEIIEIRATVHSKFEKYLDFSTKEKAEEYIFNNKPCLSLKDFEKIYTATNFTDNTKEFHSQARKLRELVKIKLNK